MGTYLLCSDHWARWARKLLESRAAAITLLPLQCESALEWFALSDSSFRVDPFSVKLALERWGDEWLLLAENYSSLGEALSDVSIEDIPTDCREIPVPSIFQGRFSRIFINSKCEMFGIRSVFGGWTIIPPEEYQTEQQFKSTLTFRENNG